MKSSFLLVYLFLMLGPRRIKNEKNNNHYDKNHEMGMSMTKRKILKKKKRVF